MDLCDARNRDSGGRGRRGGRRGGGDLDLESVLVGHPLTREELVARADSVPDSQQSVIWRGRLSLDRVSSLLVFLGQAPCNMYSALPLAVTNFILISLGLKGDLVYCVPVSNATNGFLPS